MKMRKDVSEVETLVLTQVLQCWAFPKEVFHRGVFSSAVYTAVIVSMSILVEFSIGPHGVAGNVIKGSRLVESAFGGGL